MNVSKFLFVANDLELETHPFRIDKQPITPGDFLKYFRLCPWQILRGNLRVTHPWPAIRVNDSRRRPQSESVQLQNVRWYHATARQKYVSDIVSIPRDISDVLEHPRPSFFHRPPAIRVSVQKECKAILCQLEEYVSIYVCKYSMGCSWEMCGGCGGWGVGFNNIFKSSKRTSIGTF